MSDDYEKAKTNHDFLGMYKARQAEEKEARLNRLAALIKKD